ncbi:phosphate uptake regulator PhoU [Candidatus Woesearchaeota archaeon]|nr:phosphate uptake regulator PhoU [Candidatus Woesearchaeota archaeon]
MKRKVIQLASNTLVVSLPARWVRRTSLKKGDELSIEEAGDALHISRTGTPSPTGSYRLDAGKTGFDKNVLSLLYQKGYDEVTLTNLNSTAMTQVRQKVSELIGWEIVEHSESRCVIKAVSKEIDAEFDNLLRRTFLITIEMAKDIIEAINRKQYARMGDIRSLEKTTNIFTDFCKRVLSMGSYKDPRNTIYIYILVRDLEKIADSYKRICDVFLKSKRPPKISKRTADTLSRTNDYFSMFHSLFYKYDQQLYTRFTSEGKKLVASAESALRTGSPEENIIISNLLSVINTTYEMTGPYFILNFDSIG